MRCFFDTNVLVAGSIREHPHFARASRALEHCISGEDTGLLHSHSLLEFHASMTQLPKGLAVPPTEVSMILNEGILPYMTVKALGHKKVQEVQRSAAEMGLIGGIVYDFYHLAVAREMKAEILWTFNLNHFLSIAPPNLPFEIRAP